MLLDTNTAFERLRAAGLKLTVQRRAVIEELVGDESHPTTEELARRLSARVPGMSLSTVYKVLHELVELGLVRQVDAAGAMRFDPNGADHVHVVCDECGDIFDAELPATAVTAIKSAAPKGSAITRLDIVARGVCPHCAA